MLAVGVGVVVFLGTDQGVIHTLVRVEVIGVLLHMVGMKDATSYLTDQAQSWSCPGKLI